MWGDSWINLMMKMKDMPYYHYNSKKTPGLKGDEKAGTVDVLDQKFKKYLKK